MCPSRRAISHLQGVVDEFLSGGTPRQTHACDGEEMVTKQGGTDPDPRMMLQVLAGSDSLGSLWLDVADATAVRNALVSA